MSHEVIQRLKNKTNIFIQPGTNNDESSSLNEIVRGVKRLYKNNELVPVICGDMYEYENPITGKVQSLHSYLVEKTFENKGNSIVLYESELEDIVTKSYYGISVLKSKLGNDIDRDFYDFIFDENDDLIEGIRVKKDVLEFLNVCKCPLIITTCCFKILEKCLPQKYESYWYKADCKNEFPLSHFCIYHIFGEAKPNEFKCAFDEKQLLRYISGMYTYYPLKNLTSVIKDNVKNKKLLFIGNDYPDWLFRLILKAIYGEDPYEARKDGFYLNNKDFYGNGGLSQFLADTKFKKQSDIKGVIHGVLEKIRSNGQESKLYHNKQYDIFLSHTSEDNYIVKDFVSLLESHGLKIWVDYSEIKDGAYWEKIIYGLTNSAYFMPFITENFLLKNYAPFSDPIDKLYENLGTEAHLLDHDKCWNMAYPGNIGLRVELLMASKLLDNNKRSVFSIPVILAGSECLGEEIKAPRIEKMCVGKCNLPPNLFCGIQMYVYDKSNPESFMLEYDRYKSDVNNEL